MGAQECPEFPLVFHGHLNWRLRAGAPLQKQAEQLAQHNVKVHTSTADLREPQSIRSMMAEAENVLGSVDILVNNAGVQHVAAVHEFEDGKWNDLIAVMLSAPFHTTKAALPAMIDKGELLYRAPHMYLTMCIDPVTPPVSQQPEHQPRTLGNVEQATT
jgi:NAD(P)-dependent dehydrogenase (short-subunit alcohol dehydrogenase family)